MDRDSLQKLLTSLISTWENEVIEFKEVGDGYSTSDIGKYFSALTNEANLRGHEKAWLVFGVNNRSRSITNTNYRIEPERLQSIKKQISDGTEPSMTFRNVYELHIAVGSRVIMFEIPAAPRGMPISWSGHYYARAGESLVALSVDKLDEIRQQTLSSDWSAQIVPNAVVTDLDDTAVQKARDSFIRKHANRLPEAEVRGWPLATFLDKAKLTQNGQITRTAILLLGKPEASHFLNPNPAQMTWKLEGPERAYEHFGTPFFLSTTQLYQKIRNIQLRILPQNELLPVEVSKYDQKVVLEALHNCIAHQDYTKNGRIVVTEQSDRLIFENAGTFFEGMPDDYILVNKTPLRYRNAFLVEAMVSLNMIDKMGYGIHDMAQSQARRFFPLSDYDTHDSGVVRLTIYGGVVDVAYSRLLIQKTDLPLRDVFALDRIQKKMPISDEAIGRLRRIGLIEGRKPNLHVSAMVAAVADHKAEYIRNRPQHDSHYQKLILDYLEKNKSASRKEIDELLWKLLSEALDDDQKSHKVGNLLSNLRRSGHIRNTGSRGKPVWKIAEREGGLQKAHSEGRGDI
jgi:ATP-dependent DNA helicase RecG